jgi:ferredoxin
MGNNVNMPPAFDEERPVPIINLVLCNGCGKCILICPKKALALKDDKAVVVRPEACDYFGLCEGICPTQAISRPFLIIS